MHAYYLVSFPWHIHQAINSLKIEELQVMENAFTGTLPESWASLTNLKALAVQNNQINGPLPPAWSTLKVCMSF